jgi:NAD(P) transhydrogenase subunit alpha
MCSSHSSNRSPTSCASWPQRKLTVFTLVALAPDHAAQPMDVLSSQATAAGIQVLLAASAAGRVLPMLVTAAGTLPPRVAGLGAGVAGLQAIATARRLGAIVSRSTSGPRSKNKCRAWRDLPRDDHREHAETAGGYAKELSGRPIARSSPFRGRRRTPTS